MKNANRLKNNNKVCAKNIEPMVKATSRATKDRLKFLINHWSDAGCPLKSCLPPLTSER